MKRATYPKGLLRIAIKGVLMYAEYKGFEKGICLACGRESMCHTFFVAETIEIFQNENPNAIMRFGETHAKRYVEVINENVGVGA